MIINIHDLNYFDIQQRTDWLDKNVGPRLYYLHNQRGGQGWRYYSIERTIEVEDEHWATLYLLKFGI